MVLPDITIGVTLVLAILKFNVMLFDIPGAIGRRSVNKHAYIGEVIHALSVCVIFFQHRH